MTNSYQNRNSIFDIAKGLGIILIVFGHSGWVLTKFSCLFHVPLFFIISGYFFNSHNFENLANVKKYIIKRFFSLALPYILLNLLFVILHNTFIKYNLLTINPDFLTFQFGNKFGLSEYYTNIPLKIIQTFLMINLEQPVGATWFLRELFWLSCIFCTGSFLLKTFIKNNKIFETARIFICITALITAYYFHKIHFNIYVLKEILYYSVCFEIGILYKIYSKRKIWKNNKRILSDFNIALLAISVLVLNLSKYPIKYTNPLTYVLCAISGFLLILYFSKKINQTEKLKNILCFIGSHTMPILCLHLIFFKIIVLFQVTLFHYPIYARAAFPTLENQNLWWLLYGSIGIIAPLLVDNLYRKIKTTVLKIFS